MNKLLKFAYRKAIEVEEEFQNLLRMIDSLGLSKQHKILDVGCGYGRHLRALKGRDYDVLGVDINPEIVQKNIELGLPCLTIADLESNPEKYDLILMSHVIEHFRPSDLLDFINCYLARLNEKGYLIIATPLFSQYFYDDFDHVKPYHPVGIEMVFSHPTSQVQFHSQYHLELEDIWFRKEPFKLSFFSGLYLKKYSQFPKIINFLSACLFHLSFGVIGKVDGWIGVYKKTNNAEFT